MANSINQQSSLAGLGVGAPIPQFREPPPTPPMSTPPARRRRTRRPPNFPRFGQLRQRHVRAHGGRRHA